MPNLVSHANVLEKSRLTDFKLASIDMDGTLLNEHHCLSERTVEAVKTISKKGVTVLLSTGRMVGAITDHLNQLGTPGLVVAHNGALVKDILSGHVYHHECVAQLVLKEVLNYSKHVDIVTHLNYDDVIYAEKENKLSDRFAKDLGVEMTYVSKLSDIKGEPTSILIMGSKMRLDAIIQDLKDSLSDQFDHVLIPWIEGVWQLQFLPYNTSKGRGVLRAAEQLSVPPGEILSFGDSYNDMDMIIRSGFGVAMGNAVPELKDAADFVTLSNREDGVAYFLEVLMENDET